MQTLIKYFLFIFSTVKYLNLSNFLEILPEYKYFSQIKQSKQPDATDHWFYLISVSAPGTIESEPSEVSNIFLRWFKIFFYSPRTYTAAAVLATCTGSEWPEEGVGAWCQEPRAHARRRCGSRLVGVAAGMAPGPPRAR